MTHVYLVYFFSDYIEMYYAKHEIKYVLTEVSEAIALVDSENDRLKKRQDFQRVQLAWFTKVPIGQSLFD